MRALVTGACGFVGKYLIKHLLDSGDSVLGTSLSGNQLTEINHPNFDLKQLDILDTSNLEEIVKNFNPEIVYHLAGISFVPQAENDFKLALTANVLGTQKILTVIKDFSKEFYQPTALLFVSSSEVYGGSIQSSVKVTEDLLPKPMNAYSLTKLMAEEAVLKYVRKDNINALIARPFNHSGGGQDDRFVLSSFAKQVAEIKLGKNSPVLKVGNISVLRDFSNVKDIVIGYRKMADKLLKNPDVFKGKIYNLSSNSTTSLEQVLQYLKEISGVDFDIQIDQSRLRGNEVKEIIGSSQAAKEAFGWQAEISIKETLTELYNYWLNQ